jgi:hypothetical protein
MEFAEIKSLTFDETKNYYCKLEGEFQAVLAASEETHDTRGLSECFEEQERLLRIKKLNRKTKNFTCKVQ